LVRIASIFGVQLQMNLFLWYRFLVGCYTRRSFDTYLDKLGAQIFQGMQVSQLGKEIWGNIRIQQYYVYTQRHTWIAHGTLGAGRFKLGFMQRGHAIQELGRIAPKSQIIHIDDVNHFLFYKLRSD
jgi:hypothetical protein